MKGFYIIRFFRLDELPDEEYFYSNIGEAEIHYKAFQDEASDIYFAIQLIEHEKKECIRKTAILLDLSEAEKKIILKEGCNEQFNTCSQLVQIVPLLSDDTEKEIAITARIKLENLSPAKFPIFFSLLKEERAT